MSEAPKFRIRVRGAGGKLLAEYLCPEHGRFEALVSRDEKDDPPATVACPACGREAEHAISAVTGRLRVAEVVRGKADEKPSPYAMDTQPLAEGMSFREWKEKRNAMWRAHDYDVWKKNIG